MTDADRHWVESMPDAYERWLVPAVFAPFAEDLAARGAQRRPRRVLELAAGTGVLTRELLRHGMTEIVATDLNESMVTAGRASVPEATWQVTDAMSLPFDDGEFDLVVCQFGVMFFPDKEAAFAQARRVLAPGGRFLFTVWAGLETHGFQAPLVAALRRLFPVDPPAFLTGVVHGYADADVATADVRGAGFAEVTVEALTLHGTAPSVAGIATGYCTGTPLRAGIEARSDLAATTASVTKELEAQLGAGPVTVPMTAHVIDATR
jgi:SAM-dependent methyltransferase